MDIGLLKTSIRQIPGVTTSTVPRGHFEGGKGWSRGRVTVLPTVVGGRPVQCSALFPLVLRCRFTEKGLQKTIWKRQISVLRKLDRIERAVEELSKFVDTFYTDVEAWLELADIYASQHQCASPFTQIESVRHIDTKRRYTSALQSLSHVLVLTPQNPFYVLQAGETAYTAQDIPLAMSFFLMAIEMAGDDVDDALPPPPTGITIRAWYGVELVSLLMRAVHIRLISFYRLVGSTSRGRPDARHFLAVKNACARTSAAAA